MTERWKPEYGEVYYFITRDFKCSKAHWCIAAFADTSRYKTGNCFRTEKEAQAAAEKVKALLLSLHDNDSISMKVFEKLDAFKKEICKPNLPKLTTEVFDRPDCPEWAKWAAVNGFGSLCFFDNCPVIKDESGIKYWGVRSAEDSVKNVNGKWDATDWQHSLIERPAKLPDWCKVGEWVWSDGDYYEVIETGADWFRTSRNGDTGLWGANILHQFSQARLRPYNKEELRLLVGRIVCECDGTGLLLVTAYNAGDDVEPPEPAIMTLNDWTTASELLNNGYTINNEPCGVFEHRNDAGEWME